MDNKKKRKKTIIVSVVSIVMAAAIIGGSIGGAILYKDKKQVPVVKKDFKWDDNGETDIISQRIAKELNDKNLDVTEIINDFNFEDGSFKSIEYDTDKTDTWHPIKHLQNLKSLQIALHSPGNKHYKDEKVKKAVLLGTKFWAEKKFYCEWSGWWNDIGIGLYLPDILIYGVEGLDEKTEKELVDGLMKNDLENSMVFKSVKEREVNPSGGNLTDNVLSSLKLATIKNDGSKIMWLRSLLEREAKPVPTYKFPMHRHDGDGIKEDMSNMQHWHLLYFGGYGEVYVNGMNRYINYTKGTQYALSTECLSNYAKYILDGQQYAFRGIGRDISASGRGITRVGSLNGIFRGVYEAGNILLDYKNIDRYDEIKNMMDTRFKNTSIDEYVENKGKNDAGAGGHRFFYESDYNVYNDKNYMATVRHASNRSRVFEFLNDENPFGYYTGLGATFYYNNGQEYIDIPPIYDWNKIPGTTTRQGFLPKPNWTKSYNQKGNTDKTAGVSNGKMGCSYIDLNIHGVKSKQSYFMFPKGVVCLGSDISSGKSEEIVTSINQARLFTDVVFSIDGKKTTYKEINKSAKCDYVFQNGISYISSADLNVEAKKNIKGDWKTVNIRMESTPMEADLFKIYLSHGKKPKNASYDYTVLMNTNPEATEDYLRNPTLKTIRNDKKVQAVFDSEGNVLQAVFHKGDCIELPNSTSFSVDRPCVVILETKGEDYYLSISSNDFKEHDVTVSINGKIKELTINKKSQSVKF